MNSRQSPTPHSVLPSPDITGLRPALNGVYVSIRCQGCGHTFEDYQPTLAGVALGRHACPQCRAVYEVGPEDFERALDRLMPRPSLEEMIQLTEEATRVAETWYWAEPWAGLLTYRGINLGEPTERELLSFITLGLYAGGSSGGDE